MTRYTRPAFAFRSEVVEVLRHAGFTGARTWLDEHGDPTGEQDFGDVFGLPLVVATRNQKTIDLAEALVEVEAEALRARNPVFVSVQARRGHPVREAYATTTLANLLHLVARAFPESVSGPNRDADAPAEGSSGGGAL